MKSYIDNHLEKMFTGRGKQASFKYIPAQFKGIPEGFQLDTLTLASDYQSSYLSDAEEEKIFALVSRISSDWMGTFAEAIFIIETYVAELVCLSEITDLETRFICEYLVLSAEAYFGESFNDTES
jgi:hypothetical protein